MGYFSSAVPQSRVLLKSFKANHNNVQFRIMNAPNPSICKAGHPKGAVDDQHGSHLSILHGQHVSISTELHSIYLRFSIN